MSLQQYSTDVICIKCGTAHERGIGPDQAYGCACDVKGDTVIGNFGSRVFDMDYGIFINGPLHGFDGGVLCDTCVTALLDAGLLKRQ